MTVSQLKIDVPKDFQVFAECAIVRLSALFPSVDFKGEGEAILVQTDQDSDLEAIKKEVFNQLYRAKVYEDFLPVRKRMLKASREL